VQAEEVAAMSICEVNVESAVDCQQLKRTGARSAGRFVACNDFIPTACVRNMMTWGGTWHVHLDVGGEIVTTGHMARIWEEDDSVTAE
jgi:hypothetical protein